MGRLRRRARRARFEVTRRYGLWIYGVKLSRVTTMRTSGGVYFCKTRRARSTLLIACANPLFDWLASPLQGIPERQWLEWETRLAPLAMGVTAHVQRRSLVLPRMPGERLFEYLVSTRSLEERLRAVAAAADALRRLHGCSGRFPDGVQRLWSHGDAHIKNVMFEAVSGRAIWFDFETMHNARLSDPARHADDWRAFGFSAAAFFAPRELPSLACCIANACDPATARALAVLTSRVERCPDAFHLAQAHLSFHRHQQFCAALQRELRRRIEKWGRAFLNGEFIRGCCQKF